MISRRTIVLGGIFWALTACDRHDEADVPQDRLPECSSIDLDQYFVFSGRQSIEADIRFALQEIASTDEGLALLERIHKRFNSEKIEFNIHYTNKPAGVDVVGSTPIIIIGTSELAGYMAYYTDTGDYNVSMQRMLVHELYHLAYHVEPFVNGEDFEQERILRNEEEAVSFTDNFMGKYYNEPPRQDYSNDSIHGTTPFWDIARRKFRC